MKSSRSMNEVAQAVHAWAADAFPNRTVSATFVKLFEEIGEVVKNPCSGGEYADVLILLFDLALMHGVDDLTGEVARKMEINKNRQWKEHTKTGTFHHVEQAYCDWYDLGVVHGRRALEPFDKLAPSNECKDWYLRGYEHGRNMESDDD